MTRDPQSEQEDCPDCVDVLPIGNWQDIYALDQRHAIVIARMRRSSKAQLFTREKPGAHFTKSNNKDLYSEVQMQDACTAFVAVAVFVASAPPNSCPHPGRGGKHDLHASPSGYYCSACGHREKLTHD